MHALRIYQYQVTQTFVAIFLGQGGARGTRWCGRGGTQEHGSIICLYIEIMFRFYHHYTFKDLGHMDHSRVPVVAVVFSYFLVAGLS
jgi:hypothetical protein